MKKIILIICVFCFGITYSQTKKERTTEVVITNGFGIAEIEIDKTTKYDANIWTGSISLIIPVSKYLDINTGLATVRGYGDTSINSIPVYLNSSFVKLPVDIRFNILSGNENKINAFFDLGLYGSYLITQKSEFFSDSVEQKDKNLGVNFGINFGLGVKHQINDFLGINFFLSNQKDLLSSFKSDYNKVLIKQSYLINLGLCLKI